MKNKNIHISSYVFAGFRYLYVYGQDRNRSSLVKCRFSLFQIDTRAI